MRNLLLVVTCFLSVTLSAQSNINDFIDAQVIGTEIFMEYDYQMMLDSIDALNVLLNSVAAPAITSGATGTDLVENTGADQTVYTTVATAVWPAPTYAIAGTDAALLGVNASTGVVTLTANPDYEAKSSYSFNVTATDAANNTSAATTVTFSITNVDDAIPTITSGATGTDLAENSGAGETIYTITADANDGGTIQSYAIAGTDAALLGVNASTGVVTLTADPDYETQSSYSFTVTATDEAGTSNATTVTFSITNVDEAIPTITSGATGTDLAENSGSGQTIYTITSDANDGGTIQSYAIAGTDAALLVVNASTGVVTLTADPDYETQSSYSFTVTATDETATSNATTVTFSITNVDDAIPTITSGATGTDLAENSGAGETIYTITADANDGGTIQSYAIAGTDAALLVVNASTGVVTLTADPDYETQSSYSFTVTATDEAGTSNATTVTFSITNVDEAIPTITSGATGTDLAENSGSGQTIYTITSDANDGGTIQSYAIAGTDAALLVVNASTGVVTLTADPDYETQSSYSFTVTATDETATSNATTVTFSITDVVEYPPCNGPTFEGYTYDVVQIGTQCWFAENLRTTVYADGSPIPEVTGYWAWASLSTGARCNYINYTSNVATYGRLYNWYAVNTGNLCPSGWHVPTDLEYTTLTDFLGGASVAGDAMKSSASDSPAWDGTNTSGFSALAGGYRNNGGDFYYGGDDGYFWSSSPSGTDAWYRELNGGNAEVYRYDSNQRFGFSVRCVRD